MVRLYGFKAGMIASDDGAATPRGARMKTTGGILNTQVYAPIEKNQGFLPKKAGKKPWCLYQTAQTGLWWGEGNKQPDARLNWGMSITGLYV